MAQENPPTVTYVIVCGVQDDGTVTPLKCDDKGQVVTIAGT